MEPLNPRSIFFMVEIDVNNDFLFLLSEYSDFLSPLSLTKLKIKIKWSFEPKLIFWHLKGPKVYYL
jgi:hypothetical protein